MSSPNDDDEYTRTVELEVDGATETLGDRLPRTVTDTERRVLLQQALHTRVSADVVALAHGTVDGQPASLVALRFQFSYPPQSFSRLSSAKLTISFQPADDDDDDLNFPTVHRFAPVKITADPTAASIEKDTRYSVSAVLGGGAAPIPVPASLDLTAERGAKVAYVQEFGCDVVGEPWTSDDAYGRGCEVDNAVTWHVNEHELQKKGIPRELRAVIVVGRSQATVCARVKARVKTSWGLALFGSPFSQARPLVIAESAVFGRQPGSCDFGGLGEEELAAFVGLDRPFAR